MTQTYNALEGTLSVRGAATSSRTGTTNTVAVVGGYDTATADASVTAGEETLIENPSTAEDLFGDSELPRAVQAVSANGVGTIYGVPVGETQTTESFTGTSSGTLSNTPLFNPDLHPDHDITVTDTQNSTDSTVKIVYNDSVTQPGDADTININPINGEWAADSSSDYDIQYTYGDYTSAIERAVDLPVRYVIVLTESSTVKATLATELSDIANDFDFKRGVVGARPEIDTANIDTYTPDERSWRIVEVAPALGTGADGPVRTAAAVGGFMASQPIGPDGSGLYDFIDGLSGLNTAYRASEAKSFEAVTAITRNGQLATAETTSDDNQFRLVYATEIIDSVSLDLFNVAQDYAGGPQDLDELETLLAVQLEANSNGSPPNLGFADDRGGDPFDVNVQLGNTQTTADAGVTIVPYPIAEEVNISITVADGFVQFEGAN